MATTISTTFMKLSIVTFILVHILGHHQVSSYDNERHDQSSLNETELDCRMRILAAEYAEYVQPFRRSDDIVFRQVEDALQLQIRCPEYYDMMGQIPSIIKPSKKNPLDVDTPSPEEFRSRPMNDSKSNRMPVLTCTTLICIFVDKTANKTISERIISSETADAFEVPDIETALKLSRKWNVPYNTTIIFREGIHYVGSHSNVEKEEHQPIELLAVDSGLILVGEPNAWISGAIPLPSDGGIWNDVTETKHRNHEAIIVANLTDIFNAFNVGKLPELISLFGDQSRYIRARYPNSNPEVDEWGYNSPQRLTYSIAADEVLEWHKPNMDGSRPTFTHVDLRSNKDNPNRPIKNDSTMEMNNVYSAGVGGVCSALWGNESSYWCSNSSAGGWAEVDQQAAVSGRLNIPIGMTYNQTTTIGRQMNTWNHLAEGGIVHAWHSQSWAMHMFRIKSSEPGKLYFEGGGGRQGGRNWCRCDQCSYAAPWCGQRQNPRNYTDTRLISGTWCIENILSELDMPGEFFFDQKTNLLYIYPNNTLVGTSKNNLLGERISGLRFSVLDQLIRLTNGVSNISISNLGFRDTLSTYMSDWSVPSGGDWSIHRGGAIFIEDVENIVIKDCVFSRLDGNAIFLSRRTRNVTILRNEFEWIGESAVALWGQTDGFNATNRTHPMYTNIEGNVMRELGIYQKQSSGVFISKAAFTTIQNNLMFNIARAAINFNDMMGGGDIVVWNLLFNTCRESGDHGPINSWDRQPFLTDFLDGTPSFNPIRRRISYNLIFANYGANQAVDNDDGSSWYHISRNVMYWSTGFKMDYGGHDSIFEDNIVIGYPRKSVCVGFGSFYEGHGHVVRRNFCFVATNIEAIVQLETCKDNHAILYENQYFTPNGNASCLCGYDTPPISFTKCKELYGIEARSTVSVAPNDTTVIIDLALAVLFPEDDVESKVSMWEVGLTDATTKLDSSS